MKIMFYFGHPAQYLFLREAVSRLKSQDYSIIILIKTKDVLEDLLLEDNVEYTNILPRQRGSSKTSIITSLIKRVAKVFPLVLKEKPNLQ